MSPVVDALNSAGDTWWVYVYHATWQASLVAAVVVMLVYLGKRLPPTWRYGLLLLVLVKFMIPPTLTHAVGLFHWLGPEAQWPATPAGGTEFATPWNTLPPQNPQGQNSTDGPPSRAEPRGSGGSLIGEALLAVRDAEKLRWQAWLMMTHAAGSLIVLAWIARRMIRLVSLTKRAQLVRHGPLKDRLPALAKQVNGPEDVDLLITDEPVPPMAFWLLRMKVVLPSALVQRLSGEELESLVAWLLIQHRRNDWAGNLLQLIVCAAWWFNPLAWAASVFTTWTRAECCDDALLGSGAVEPEKFRATLTEAVVEVARPHPVTPLAGLLERIRPLPLRVGRVTDPRVMRGAGFSYAALVPLLLIALVVLPGLREGRAVPGYAATALPPVPMPDAMRLEVVDAETGLPIAEAEVALMGGSPVEKEGEAWSVGYDKRVGQLNVVARAKGYVPMQLVYQPDFARLASTTPLEIPDRYTLKLPRSVSIGGVVKDETGNPVSGTQVFLYLPSRRARSGTRGFHGESPVLGEQVYTTDERGRWTCDTAPREVKEVMIRLVHPEYLSDIAFGTRATPAVARLLDGTSEMVLHRGLVVEGVVLDDRGNPVNEATVTMSSEPFYGGPGGPPEVVTEEDGRFRFENVQPGQTVLMASAPGLSQHRKPITVSKGLKPVELRLQPGRVLRGRVVGSDGQPLEGATVAAVEWRSQSGLARQVTTEVDGSFEMADMPQEPVAFIVSAPGHMSVNRSLAAGEESHEITLGKALRIQGSVTDGETGEPIETFTLIQGQDQGAGNSPWWNRYNAPPQTGGRFETFFTGPNSGHYLMVEAEGYLPEVSRAFRDDEGEVTHDFKLRKGAGITGVVRSPDGKPIAGTTLAVATPSRYTIVQEGNVYDPTGVATQTTDGEGRYKLPPQVERWALVVAHETGYAEIDGKALEAAGDVTLQPWGRVEGVLMIGSKPGTGQRITVNQGGWTQGEPQIQRSYSATTDDEGRFTLDTLPPGEMTIARMVQIGPNSWAYRAQKSVKIGAGETTRLQLGGDGRAVVGRVLQPDDGGEELDLDYGSHAIQSRIDAGAATRGIVGSLFGSTQPAAPETRYYSFALNPDGTFRIDDVPPGGYTLRILVHEPRGPFDNGPSRPLATATVELTIRRATADKPDAPIDLGDLQLQRAPAPGGKGFFELLGRNR